MGYYNDLPYGLEIMSQNETTLYQIASSYENATNYYKTPDIAPSLYEISDEVNNLIDVYNKYKDNENYNNINNKVKNYFINFDGNIESINNLINEYENFIVEEEKINTNNNYVIIFLAGVCAIIIIKKVKK